MIKGYPSRKNIPADLPSADDLGYLSRRELDDLFASPPRKYDFKVMLTGDTYSDDEDGGAQHDGSAPVNHEARRRQVSEVPRSIEAWRRETFSSLVTKYR